MKKVLILIFSIILFIIYYLLLNSISIDFYNVFIIQLRLFFMTIFFMYIFYLLDIWKKYLNIFLVTNLIIFLIFPFIFKDISYINISNWSIIENVSTSILYLFYNPVIPIINISLIQITFVILLINVLVFLKSVVKNIFFKKDYFIFAWIISLWVILRLQFSPWQIWDTNFHHIAYTTWVINDNALYFLYGVKSMWYEWWSSFTDILFLFKKVLFINDWSLQYTFLVNFVLDIFNIILVFLFGYIISDNKRVWYLSSFLYWVSVVTVKFSYSEHVFVLWISFLMLMLIFLSLFIKTENKRFFILSLLALVWLYYTHTIFILSPLIVILYLLLFYNPRLLKQLLSFKLISLYISIILLLSPVLYSKFDLASLWYWARMQQYWWIYTKLVNTNFIDLIFWKFNTFLYYDYLYIWTVLLWIWWVCLTYSLRKKLIWTKIWLLFIWIYIITTYPFYSFMPFEWMLNAHLLKNYVTLPLFFVTIGFIWNFVIKNKYINKLFFIFLVILIWFLSYSKINTLTEYYNLQNDFKIYKETNKYFNDNNIQPSVDLNLHPILTRYYPRNTEDWEYVLISSRCFSKYFKELHPYINCPDISQLEIIIEYNIACLPYDMEETCLQDDILIWLYKKHEE